MPCLRSCERTLAKPLLSYAPGLVTGAFALVALAAQPNGVEQAGPSATLQIAQEKGGGKGKGKGGGAGGTQKQKQNADDDIGVDDEEGGGAGKHCPEGQSIAPLRGRGGSGTTRGAGCM